MAKALASTKRVRSAHPSEGRGGADGRARADECRCSAGERIGTAPTLAREGATPWATPTP